MHLGRCPLGKGDGEHVLTRYATLADKIGNALGQGACFPRSGAGDHDHRSRFRLDSLPLRLVEPTRDRASRGLRHWRASWWHTWGTCDVWCCTGASRRQHKKRVLALELLAFGATKD